MKTKLTVNDAIALSGDSRFLRVSYDGTTAAIKIELGEDNQEVILIIRTDAMVCEIPTTEEPTLRICRIEFELLGKHLLCERGHYVAPSDFGSMMKDVRSGRSLAYGKRRANDSGIFSIVGYSRLVACYVASASDIWIEK